MDEEQLQRENIKTRLGIDDDELDRLLQIFQSNDIGVLVDALTIPANTLDKLRLDVMAGAAAHDDGPAGNEPTNAG